MDRNDRHLLHGLALVFAIGFLIGIMLGVIGSAGAYGQEATPQGVTVEIPIETTYPLDARNGARGEPGDLFFVGEAAAPVGFRCVAELEFTNNEQESMHPNNDILVGPATFTDVENGMFQAAGLTFTSDGTNQVFVRLGDDGVFSGGFLLEVTCNPPTTTTTTEASSTTSSSTPGVTVPPETPSEPLPSTVPPATTTTEPPPVGGVDTGYGSCADGACDDDMPWPMTVLVSVGATVLIGAAFRAWSHRGDTE